MTRQFSFSTRGRSIERTDQSIMSYLPKMMEDSDPGGVIDIADPMTGTFVFIKLDYLKNFMSNECSMKCL